VDKAIEMLRSGVPVGKVAGAMGVSLPTLHRHLEKRGYAIDARRGARFDWLAAKKMLEDGKSVREVAQAAGASMKTIKKYGLKAGRRRRRSRSKVDGLRVSEMRKAGKSIREVAEAIGVNVWVIRDYERRERTREQQGQGRPPEKPDPLHVPTMLRMHRMLATPEEIGAALGCPPAEIEEKLKELGLVVPDERRREPDVNRATAMLVEGATIGAVVAACGMEKKKVTAHLQKLLVAGVIPSEPKRALGYERWKTREA
jgi:hypothetical protein